MQDFWTIARVIGNTIEATVNSRQLVINEEIIRAALHLGDLDMGDVCYVAEIRDHSILRFGFSGHLPSSSYHKGMLREKWRFFFHIIMQCFALRKVVFDGMSHNLLSAMIGLTFNRPYNFARMILQALKTQLDYVVDDPHLLLLYPRFLMIIFRHLIPNLPITNGLQQLVLQRMSRRVFVDFRTANPSVRSPRLSELRPMLGAIMVDDYSPANDAIWNEISTCVNQLFEVDVDGGANIILQQPAVQPQIDPQQ
ncbi:hypothetical protein Hdeb2414_s0034g00725871 [Helianthus debilis subsp. tardiflorus]